MKKRWIWILSIVILLLVVRISLPYIIKNYANRVLEEMEGYDGSVQDIDLHLFRGAYVVKGFELIDESNAIPVPFLSIQRVDLSLDWGALIQGKITSEIILHKPIVNFAISEEASQDGTEADWQQMIQELMPININRFEIISGVISYYDFTTRPQIEVSIENLDLLITNLSNVEKANDKLPSTLNATGSTIGGGALSMAAAFNVLKDIPDIDLDLQLEQVDMTALNDFMRAYSNTDVEKGTFNLYTEIVIDDAQLKGYVRPVLEDLEILDWENEEGSFLKKAWETVVAGVKEILENPKEEQVATQTPLTGNLREMNLDAGVWPTIWELFRNAFVEALSKRTEDAIEFPIEQ